MSFKKSPYFFVGGVLLLFSSIINAAQADIKITWENPENYSDIEATYSSSKKFKAHVFKQLEDAFKSDAALLPKGSVLAVVVYDLDLAGKVFPGHFVGLDTVQETRVVKRLYFPEIKFKYNLTDKASGQALSSGDVTLKDTNFLEGIQSARYRTESLRFEKRMLTKWLKKTFQLDKG